jgi:hypothetical protein
MRNEFIIITASLLLISFVCMEGNSVKANPEVYASMPKLQITSPVENVTYNTSSVSFAVKGEVMQKQFINQSFPYFYCYLDSMNFTVNASYETSTSDGWLIFNGTITLSDLSNGRHSVSVNQISNSQISRMLNPVSASFDVENSNSAINPSPVAPEFTVTFGGNIPTYYDGFTVPTANFTIKNQLLPAYTTDGTKIGLYYYIRAKEHLNNSWMYGSIVEWSDSKYTVYSMLVVNGREGPQDRHVSGQVDFQVAARIASFTADNVFVGQTSDWSNTQTITIPANVSSTPTVPELQASTSPLLLTIIVVTGALIYFNNHKQTITL